MPHIAYFHGFASSAQSRKGVAVGRHFEHLGVPVARADLNVPSFASVTISGALRVVDALTEASPAESWSFIGSSMGGYVAALWASLHAARVRRLVLLCPGFDLPARWPHLVGQDAFRRWQDVGYHTFADAVGTPTAVHWGFIEDARRHPTAPDVGCDTLIIHGVRDEVVPIATSRAYAAARPHVSLLEVDDDHALASSIELICEEAARFLGIVS